MALSLEGIYKPLNDFFLSHFRTDADSVVQFRFDQFGSLVSDEDFLDPRQPQAGYSPAIAREKFSELVNHIPIEQSDGLHVFLSLNAIDSAYFFRVVQPSIPVVPADADGAARDAVVGAFSTLKADAQQRWQNIAAESSTGLMVSFKPTLATPEQWYDKNDQANWTSQSFDIGDPSPAPPTAPPPPVWKLKLEDAKFQTILQRADVPVAVAQPAAVAPAALAARALRPAFMTARFAPIAAATIAAPAVAAPDGVVRRFRTLDLEKRIVVGQALAAAQPTQPAATNRISIAFDYCLVKAQRPWFSDALVNDRSWCIPGVPKGELTAPDPTAVSLRLVPIAAVVIKNLTIEANWSSADVEAAKNATDFGPFKIGGEVVNNKLTHPGLQIVGWLVQRLPDLPPNDPS
jgi:hypothetical protein